MRDAYTQGKALLVSTTMEPEYSSRNVSIDKPDGAKKVQRKVASLCQLILLLVV